MNTKVLTRKYYLGKLWKITTHSIHLEAGSIYKNSRNRFIKIYERREKIGDAWDLVRHSTLEGYNA